MRLTGNSKNSQPYMAYAKVGRREIPYRIGILHEQGVIKLFALSPEGTKHLAAVQAEFDRSILPTLKLERPIWPRPSKGTPWQKKRQQA